MFLKIFLLALVVGSTLVDAVVDTKSPDISCYNLNKVNPSIYQEGADGSVDEKNNNQPQSGNGSDEDKSGGQDEIVVAPAEDLATPIKEEEFTVNHLMALRHVAGKILDCGRHGICLTKGQSVPVNLIFNFYTNWRILRRANLNLNTRLGTEALAFRSDKNNIGIASRVERSVHAYIKMSQTLKHIQELQDKPGSADELKISFWILEKSMKELDPMLDVSGIKKAIDSYKSKGVLHRKLHLRFWKHDLNIELSRSAP